VSLNDPPRLFATGQTLFFGRFNILIVSLACCGVLEMAMWPVVTDRVGVFAFTILFGFFTGIYFLSVMFYELTQF
jgi:hypothetical protein